MCVKLAKGQTKPTLKDCFNCSQEDKKPVVNKAGYCPHDLYREKYGSPTDEAYNIEIKSS